MELKEALNILDQVCAVHQGVRQEHIALQQAIQVVTKATVLKSEAKDGSKKKESDGNKK